MNKKEPLVLEPGTDWEMPSLFSWSIRYGGHSTPGRIQMVATTRPGSVLVPRSGEDSSLVLIELSDEDLFRLSDELVQAAQIRQKAIKKAAN